VFKRRIVAKKSMGLIYFIQAGRTGDIKIGWTKTDAGKRLKELQTGNSKRLRVLGFIPESDRDDEKALHKRFREFRQSGEWFADVTPIRDYIEAEAQAWVEAPLERSSPRFEARQGRSEDGCPICGAIIRHGSTDATFAENYANHRCPSRTLEGIDASHRPDVFELDPRTEPSEAVRLMVGMHILSQDERVE
jgi:hypothetical protein